MSAQVVPFVDHGKTQHSANDDGPTLVVATQPGRTGLGQLVTSAQRGRLFIAVFAGTKRSGGFAVEVDRLERRGDPLVIRARFIEPPRSAPVIQMLASPAQRVSTDGQSASGVREVVLVDQAGAEVARSAVPQSQP